MRKQPSILLMVLCTLQVPFLLLLSKPFLVFGLDNFIVIDLGVALLGIIWLLGYVYICLSLYLGDANIVSSKFFLLFHFSPSGTPIIYMFFVLDGVPQMHQALLFFLHFFLCFLRL